MLVNGATEIQMCIFRQQWVNSTWLSEAYITGLVVNYGISNTIERYHSLSLRQQYALQTWILICFHNAYSPICCLDMIKTNADSLSLIPLEITFDRTSVTSWINTNNSLKIIVCKVVTTLVQGETKFTPCLLLISDHRHHWFRQRLVISS